MAGKSHIEWTEMTWNPVTGCTKVSPGCKFCYAEALSKRLKAMGAVGYENGFAISLLPERLNQPHRRKTPTIWFVNSMSDLFHDSVPVHLCGTSSWRRSRTLRSTYIKFSPSGRNVW